MNDLAAVLSPAEARASVTVGDEAGVPMDEHLPMFKKPSRRADLSKKLEEVLSLIGL